MKIMKILTAYALVIGVAKYRKSRKNHLKFKNEKCENYYRCDDVENDGRGDY